MSLERAAVGRLVEMGLLTGEHNYDEICTSLMRGVQEVDSVIRGSGVCEVIFR